MIQSWTPEVDLAEAWLKEHDKEYGKFGNGGKKKRMDYPYLTTSQMERRQKRELTILKEDIIYATNKKSKKPN